MCQSCSVTPLQAPKPKAKELLAEYLLPALIQLAILLGKRVADTWRSSPQRQSKRWNWPSGSTMSF